MRQGENCARDWTDAAAPAAAHSFVPTLVPLNGDPCVNVALGDTISVCVVETEWHDEDDAAQEGDDAVANGKREAGETRDQSAALGGTGKRRKPTRAHAVHCWSADPANDAMYMLARGGGGALSDLAQPAAAGGVRLARGVACYGLACGTAHTLLLTSRCAPAPPPAPGHFVPCTGLATIRALIQRYSDSADGTPQRANAEQQLVEHLRVVVSTPVGLNQVRAACALLALRANAAAVQSFLGANGKLDMVAVRAAFVALITLNNPRIAQVFLGALHALVQRLQARPAAAGDHPVQLRMLLILLECKRAH